MFLLCSCSSLSPEAKQIVVVDELKYVAGCSYTGTVTANSPMFSDPAMTMMMNGDSLTRLKNAAAKIGNVLVLIKNKESAITGSNREGYVYKCPANIIFVQAPVTK